MFVKEIKYDGGSRVLAWQLDEEAAQLLNSCREAGLPCEDLTELPAKRQREKAAELLLLCRAFGHPVALCHDRQGAPSVEGEAMNISITHTSRLVAVALDENRIVGLDAERMDRHQVIKVRGKFLNASEQQFIAPDDLTAHVVAWTAKEAIIKAERNSALDWTEGIVLEPFVIDVPEPDRILLAATCAEHRYCLEVRFVDGHCLTLASLR